MAPQPRRRDSPRGFFKEFRSLFPYVKQHRYAYFAGLFFLLLTDGAQLIIPQLMRRAVDLIASGEGTAAGVGRLMAIMVGVAALVATGRFAWRNFIIGSARRVEADLRADLYRKLLVLDGGFYARHKVGDLMARATNDMRSIRMATGMALIAFVDGLFMTVAILITLFVGYGRLGLLLIAPFPVITLMAIYFGRLIGPLFGRVQESFSRISGHVQETLSGIRVVKAFVKEKRSLGQFRDINDEYGRANMDLVRFWGMLFPAMGFFAGLMLLLLLLFGGLRVIDGTLSPGQFVAAISYLAMLQWPAMGAGWVVNMLQRGAASMKRINDVLREEPAIVDLPGAVDQSPEGDLVFRDVRFAFPESEPVLRGISLAVPRGMSMGLLGRTGSGKTTLVSLVPRMIDPPPGAVLIGDRDIRLYTRSALRHTLSVVPQDVFLFSETIRENVTFTQPDATDAQVDEAVEVSGLSRDIPLFPEGLDTQVGEKGVTLSGGQKQRVAIARSLLANPEILILDDALSAVDAETEEVILDGLFALREGKTTVLISHRVSALARCDRTAVLEEGVITAEGTHDELLDREGLYREIAELQRMEDIEERTA